MKKKLLKRLVDADTLIAKIFQYARMEDVLSSSYAEEFVKTVFQYSLEKSPEEAYKLFNHEEYWISSCEDFPDEVIVNNHVVEKLCSEYVEWKLLTGVLN